MRGACTSVLLLFFLSLCTTGTEPVDPLVRREEGRTHTWQVGLGYVPVGTTGGGVDSLGVPYEYTRMAHGVELSLSGTLRVTKHWRTGIELADTTWFISERRTSLEQTADKKFQEREFSYSVFGEARLAPDSALDPRVTMAVGDPRQSALDLSMSVLRDPLALLGRLGYARYGDSPHDALSFALGAAFVANAWMTLITQAGWEVPLGDPALPATTLEFLVQYDLDMVGNLRLKGRVNLRLQQPPLLGVGLELTGTAE